MPLGQIVEMALRSLQIALAADAARSDRDLRLADMIAGTQRIAFRIEEDQHAVLLIFLEQEEEGEGNEGRAGEARTDEKAQGDARQEHHGDTPGHHRDRGAEIGLSHDEEPGHADQHQRRPDRRPAARLPNGQHLVEARNGEHHQRFHEFGRLQPDETQFDPALAAAFHRACELDEQQQYRKHCISGEGAPFDEILAEQPDHQRHCKEHDEAQRMNACPGRDAAPGGRIEYDDAEPGDGDGNEDDLPRQLRHRAGNEGQHQSAASCGGGSATRPSARARNDANSEAIRSWMLPPQPASIASRLSIAFCGSNI